MENILIENINNFFKCFLNTIFIWVFSSLISLLLGLIFGIILSKYNDDIYFKNILKYIILLLRGIPFYIQLSIFYFLISDFFIFLNSSIISGIFSLGICSSAYTSIIIRTLIDDFDSLQWNTARILGYSKFKFFIYILFPQIYFKFFSLMINEFDSILKSTTILSTIGVMELTRFGFNIISKTMNPIPIYLFLGVLYFLLSSILLFFVNYFSVKDKNIF